MTLPRNGQRSVKFTEEDAQRIALSVEFTERFKRTPSPSYLPRAVTAGEMFIVARFSGSWSKGSTKTVERLNDDWTLADAPRDIDVVNLASDIDEPTGSPYGKCGAVKYGNKWVLIWAEC